MLKRSNIRLLPVLVWLVIMIGPGTPLMLGTARVMQSMFPNVVAFFLQIALIYLIALLANLAFARFTTWWLKRRMMGAFLRGDFALALRRLNFAERYMVFASREYMTIQRLIILAAMLRLDEARELALRTIRRVDDETEEQHRVALLILGEIAHIEKQYEVALDYFTRLIEMKANFLHINHKELAVLRLKLGQPEKALESVNQSLDLLNDTSYRQEVFKDDTSDAEKAVGRTMATKAWILAARGHVEEVESLLQNAIIKVENDHPPLLAEFHLYAGRAYHAMNNLAEARHLQKAAELDPQGITGAEAREILATLDSGAA
ncbi:MAG: hypothetical protein L0154_10045 [Chloroflexi bacterium]|nr:hypothetical protein [Chloroflexota bacterium]